MSLSNVRSDTALRGRSFSFYSRFNSLELIRPHTTVLLAPAIIRLFPNLNLANSVNPRRDTVGLSLDNLGRVSL